MALRMASVASVISFSVFSIPTEKRIIPRDAVESGFIALITCEGSSESAKHAEPDEAQIPSLSSSKSKASDSMP
jgi:hypothetical protein